MDKHNPFTKAHIIYVGILTLIAISGLIMAFRLYGSGLFPPDKYEAFITFTLLAISSRLFAFRIAGGVTFSLDTGVYIASLVTIGGGYTSLVIFIAVLARGVFEMIRRESIEKKHWPLGISIVKLLFGPSVTAAIGMTIGLLLHPDSLFAKSLSHPVWQSAGIFLAITCALIFPQFTVVNIAYRLNGLNWKRIAKEIVLPGLLGEIAFVPIGFALALAYKDRDMRTLGALAISYLIFNYIFKRMWESSRHASERANELALIEEAGRAAASTLDIGEVARRLGIAILGAIEGARGVVLTIKNDSKLQNFARAVDRAEKPSFIKKVTDLLEKADLVERLNSGSIMVNDIIITPLFGPDGSNCAYLSVILSSGTQVAMREYRILESFGRQAAIAIENWRLYNMATEDGLTGLYVRRYIEARLHEEFDRATRTGVSFCLMMIDVDNLKTVNDMYGHAAGDTLLREVASAIRESIRSMDVPGRWGGDEFAVLLPTMKLSEGLVVASRLSQATKKRAFSVNENKIEPSVSIGIASHPESGAHEPGELIALADEALYAVKKSGCKGSVVAARPSP